MQKTDQAKAPIRALHTLRLVSVGNDETSYNGNQQSRVIRLGQKDADVSVPHKTSNES